MRGERGGGGARHLVEMDGRRWVGSRRE